MSSDADLARRSGSARVIEMHWPALLAGSACSGLAVANWVMMGTAVCMAVALAALVAIAVLDGSARLLVVGVVLAAVGLWWGSLRMEALRTSVLAATIGESGTAELVVTGPARRTAWAVRMLAEVRSFRQRAVRERVLLTLPVGRSPPRGAVVEAFVRVAEPRPAANGFDERAWLARQGIHVVMRGEEWRQVGRRGGIAAIGDRIRERVEQAVERGTSGVRRGIVLGVVLGEDEGLPAQVQDEFRASGLCHLLSAWSPDYERLSLGVGETASGQGTRPWRKKADLSRV